MSSASATSLVDTPLVRSLLTIHCLTTYKEACQRGEVAIGKMLVVETNQLHGPTYVINFPTKKQWRAPSQLSYIDAGLVDLVVPMCCIALIMVAARRIRIFLHSSSLSSVVAAAGSTPVMFDSGARDATDAVIALSRGATAVGIGRPYAYALSYGGAESLTHFLHSFLAELDLCMAICGFKDIASLKEAGCELATDLPK